MRISLCLLVLCAAATAVHAQDPSRVDGSWLLTADVYGTPAHDRLVLKSDGGKLTGSDGQSKLEGTIDGDRIHFISTNDRSTDEYTGTVSGDTMSGTFVHSDKDNPTPETLKWTARRLPTRPAGPPRSPFHRAARAKAGPGASRGRRS